MKSITRTFGAATLAAALLVPAVAVTAAVAATPAPASADEPGPTCEVAGGELTWGVKEAFRSYISGTIANGEWTTSDGASYETPSFTFSDAQGEIDADTGEGSISFAGTVNFSGHEGVLNLTIANPTIEFQGDGSAHLLLDTKSNNAEGELVVDNEQVVVGKIGSIGEADPSSGSLTVTDAETILTADGAEAFSGFYATGEKLDPVTFDVQFGPCAAAEASDSASPTDAEEGPVMAEADDPGVPWLPIAIGALALVVIAVATTLLLAGRKKSGYDAAVDDTVDGTSDDPESSPPAAD